MKENLKYEKKEENSMIKKFSNITWLIVITIIFSLVALFTGKVDLFALNPSNVLQVQYLWALITYMFVHLTIFHLFLNMLMLFSFGTLTERIIGKKEIFVVLSTIWNFCRSSYNHI